MAATSDQLIGQVRVLNANVQALLDYLPGITQHLNALGVLMSELDQATEALQSAVTELIGTIGTAPAELQAALDQIASLNDQITTLSADDSADQAQIDALTAERDQLVADSQENVTKIQDVTAQVKALAPHPEQIPEPAPVEPSGPTQAPDSEGPVVNPLR